MCLCSAAGLSALLKCESGMHLVSINLRSFLRFIFWKYIIKAKLIRRRKAGSVEDGSVDEHAEHFLAIDKRVFSRQCANLRRAHLHRANSTDGPSVHYTPHINKTKRINTQAPIRTESLTHTSRPKIRGLASEQTGERNQN